MKKIIFFLTMILVCVSLISCSKTKDLNQKNTGVDSVEITSKTAGVVDIPQEPSSESSAASGEYRKITPEEAYSQMESDESITVVDVREENEYASGHIEGAILVPSSKINTIAQENLPDKNAVILVYCQSGRRSEAASKKLIEMGYINVYDFGGIINWPYDIVK